MSYNSETPLPLVCSAEVVNTGPIAVLLVTTVALPAVGSFVESVEPQVLQPAWV